MIGIHAQFACQNGKNSDFEKLMSEFATIVKANEPGVLVYELCRDKKNADSYFMLEVYTDQEALEAHNKTAHMAELVGKIGAYLAGAPVISRGEVVH